MKDLQECLSRTQLKPVLTQSLKLTLEARLLHQGATTEDILIAYVSAIRAFSVLDPTGVLLDVACEPIKYLIALVLISFFQHQFTHFRMQFQTVFATEGGYCSPHNSQLDG